MGFLGRAGWCARLISAPRVSAASAVDAVYARSCCAAFLKTSEVFSQLEGKSSSFRFTRNYLAAVNWSTATAAAKQSRRALKLGPAPPPNPRATCICPPAPAALPGPAGSVLFYFGEACGLPWACPIDFRAQKNAVACSRGPEFRIGIAEGRTVDVLPKKRADDPHSMPSMRCPSPTYHCQTVQPLQNSLLRPRVPENTLGRGRPRQTLQED